jgi:hypothetical protein
MRKPTSVRAAVGLGLIAGGLLWNSPAQSCSAFRGFRLEAITKATLVFRGQVVDYSLVYRPEGSRFATITFKIVDVYRGDRYDTLTLSWPNSTFALPETWRRPTDLVVAAVPNGDRASLYGQPLGVLQESCSEPFLLKDTEELRAKVRALLGQ